MEDTTDEDEPPRRPPTSSSSNQTMIAGEELLTAKMRKHNTRVVKVVAVTKRSIAETRIVIDVILDECSHEVGNLVISHSAGGAFRIESSSHEWIGLIDLSNCVSVSQVFSTITSAVEQHRLTSLISSLEIAEVQSEVSGDASSSSTAASPQSSRSTTTSRDAFL